MLLPTRSTIRQRPSRCWTCSGTPTRLGTCGARTNCGRADSRGYAEQKTILPAPVATLNDGDSSLISVY